MNKLVNKSFLTFLITSLISLNSYGSIHIDSTGSVYLNQDEKAPFSGFLLPDEEVKQLRDDSLERDMYKTTNDLKDQQIKLLGDQNTNLSKTLESTSSLSTWEKIGYFTAGVILTGLAVGAAVSIVK
jgi:hypothetical protein